MYLLNVHTRKLEYFGGTQIPLYAILSHTWGDDEITFQEIQSADVEERRGYEKVKMTCEAAASRGLDYVWIDTCCIDKSSSAELSEAINSMFRFYEDAALCFVHLKEVQSSDQDVGRNWNLSFSRSRWFKRGWTLQELIASSVVIFMDQQWREIGTKSSLTEYLSSTTRIPTSVLRGEDLRSFSVAQKMSWASGRETTRIEDRAYSLLGIFGVTMPLLYGEGQKAFTRLQEEIIKTDDDYSIFVWKGPDVRLSGPLAPSPDVFYDSYNVIMDEELVDLKEPISLNNKGVFVWTRILECATVRPDVFAVLPCKFEGHDQRLAIRLETLSKSLCQYRRVDHPGMELIWPEDYSGLSLQKICIQLGRQKKVAPRVLSEAASEGKTQLVKLVLEEGTNRNHSYYEGRSALANAILNGHEQVFKLLVDHYGASPNLNRLGERALSTRAGETDNVIIKHLLLGQDTDPRQCSHADPSLLIAAASKGQEDMVSFLLSHGADPNWMDSAYRTPLSEAVSHRQLQVARLLLKSGADLEHITNPHWESILVTASRSGYASMVDILLDLGASVESRDVTQSTALIQSAKRGHAAIVERLLQAGADPEAKDDEGYTSLCWAARLGKLPVVKVLLEKGANVDQGTRTGATPLILATRGTGLEVAIALVERGANVHAKDVTGYDPIICAIEWHKWASVKLLLANGVDPHVKRKYPPVGEEALGRLLRWASANLSRSMTVGERDVVEMTEILITAGADVNAVDDDGNTPLHRAAQWGNEAIVLKLSEQGAYPSLKNREGYAPLAWRKITVLRMHEANEMKRKSMDGDEPLANKRRRLSFSDD